MRLPTPAEAAEIRRAAGIRQSPCSTSAGRRFTPAKTGDTATSMRFNGRPVPDPACLMPNASTTLIGGWHEQNRQGTRKRTAPQRFDFCWRMMADTDLSPTAKCVAAALLLKFHNAKTGRCNPGAASIARTAGSRSSHGFLCHCELKDAGWITVESTKGGSASNTNQYGFDFKRVKSASPPTGAQNAPPTGAQDAPVHEMGGRGAQFAHEPLRTTHPFGVGGGEGKFPPAARLTARRQKFEELRQLWQRALRHQRGQGAGGLQPRHRRWRGDASRHPRQRTALGGGKRATLPAQAGGLAGQWRMAKRPPNPTQRQTPQTKRRRGGRKPGARSRKERTMTIPKDKLPTPSKPRR